jgi:hypothetical protein
MNSVKNSTKSAELTEFSKSVELAEFSKKCRISYMRLNLLYDFLKNLTLWLVTLFKRSNMAFRIAFLSLLKKINYNIWKYSFISFLSVVFSPFASTYLQNTKKLHKYFFFHFSLNHCVEWALKILIIIRHNSQMRLLFKE